MRQACPRDGPSGATCVQRLDGSRDSAIHTMYRISLRSSSMREPRYPLPGVISFHFFGLDRWHDAEAPPSASASMYSLAPTRAVFRHRDQHAPEGKAVRGRWSRGGCPPRHRFFTCATVVFSKGNNNDPSAGSPTETLLRLLLPLNDKVQWTSRDVTGGEPPASPRSEHFTGPFNR